MDDEETHYSKLTLSSRTDEKILTLCGVSVESLGELVNVRFWDEDEDAYALFRSRSGLTGGGAVTCTACVLLKLTEG